MLRCELLLVPLPARLVRVLPHRWLRLCHPRHRKLRSSFRSSRSRRAWKPSSTWFLMDRDQAFRHLPDLDMAPAGPILSLRIPWTKPLRRPMSLRRQ